MSSRAGAPRLRPPARSGAAPPAACPRTGRVAVAAVRSVERDEHEIGSGELAQRPARARPGEHGVAQRAGEVVEHRGPRQEAQAVSRKVGEQLVAQVVRHDPVVTGEAGQRPIAIRLVLQRQRREIEAGGPALRALHEQVDVARAQPEPVSSRPASARVMTRSRARSSVMWRCARMRPTGSGGSMREASASCEPRGM